MYTNLSIYQFIVFYKHANYIYPIIITTLGLTLSYNTILLMSINFLYHFILIAPTLVAQAKFTPTCTKANNPLHCAHLPY